MGDIGRWSKSSVMHKRQQTFVIYVTAGSLLSEQTKWILCPNIWGYWGTGKSTSFLRSVVPASMIISWRRTRDLRFVLITNGHAPIDGSRLRLCELILQLCSSVNFISETGFWSHLFLFPSSSWWVFFRIMFSHTRFRCKIRTLAPVAWT